MQTVRILIDIPADLEIDGTLTPAPQRAVIGQPYNYSGTIAITGGLPPYKAASIIGSAQSGGLTLAVSGNSVTISGTPTGEANFEINVPDSAP